MKTNIKEIDIYINYRHLYIHPRKNEVIFLGYDLYATKTEYYILRALAQSPKAPLSAERIILLCEKEMSKENLAFHISSINRKAKAVGNRPLIKNIAKIGYFLNEEM